MNLYEIFKYLCSYLVHWMYSNMEFLIFAVLKYVSYIRISIYRWAITYIMQIKLKSWINHSISVLLSRQKYMVFSLGVAFWSCKNIPWLELSSAWCPSCCNLMVVFLTLFVSYHFFFLSTIILYYSPWIHVSSFFILSITFLRCTY